MYCRVINVYVRERAFLAVIHVASQICRLSSGWLGSSSIASSRLRCLLLVLRGAANPSLSCHVFFA
ncbi:uncharacterized protein MYCFIDRAFT_212726 [Pseudocercospora fijiensis CIRAD86]|uniref:Uncharacterized protein n=1 Tax=Pseudocercospora fijiensis (strain CIRAD86) TaxID=383855 RepID=M2ZD12_PSEFD|nr:uncharacterized protein MYCFIDRAFT_212726 [Pseudocercospora fijiensis CIRAD86]EME77009.1 hypothetical protein MYCFIDRAFT_212726 [Pseudocercospora fijiensis CIRAD86]